MGNSCCSCLTKRERSVEDLLDGSLEDKLLGKRDDEVETTTEEEAWRQRRKQAKDESDLSLKSLSDNDDRGADTVQGVDHAQLIWDLSDRNTVRAVHKEVEEAVEDEEDDDAFGSAKEDSTNDDNDDEVHIDGEFSADRLMRLSSRASEDSYASFHDYERGESSKVFRDTQLDAEGNNSFLATSASSSLRETNFMDDDDQEDDNDHEPRPSNESTSSSKSRKKKSRRKNRK